MNPEDAKEKWFNKTKDAGEKWKEATIKADVTFCKAVADFLQMPDCNKLAQQHYKEGVGRVSPEEFQKSLENKGDIWLERLRAALGSEIKKEEKPTGLFEAEKKEAKK